MVNFSLKAYNILDNVALYCFKNICVLKMLILVINIETKLLSKCKDKIIIKRANWVLNVDCSCS